jgi:hypothetical protein
MESMINPNEIQKRAEAISAPAVETPPVVTPPVDTTVVTPPVVTPPVVTPPADASVKPDAKVEPIKTAPNDPTELRKWATKASQENAALRAEMKAVKEALDKLTKKPIDYKELAKNPDSIKAHIEEERQEAIAEAETRIQELQFTASKNATEALVLRNERDSTNYPEWSKRFPMIQRLAANVDGRVNFDLPEAEVLQRLYDIAGEDIATLAPATPAAAAAPVAAAASTAPAMTPEQIKALEEAAEKRGFEKAQAATRAEQSGAGLGSAGKGGRQQPPLDKQALWKMDKKDLKALISNK